MVRLQFFVTRVLTPAQGQEALSQMFNKIKELPGGTGAVRTPANVSENPFPDWLVKLLEERVPNLEYDQVNFCYFVQLETEKEAVYFSEYLVKMLKPWGEQHEDPKVRDVMGRFQVRTMVDVEDVTEKNF